MIYNHINVDKVYTAKHMVFDWSYTDKGLWNGHFYKKFTIEDFLRNYKYSDLRMFDYSFLMVGYINKCRNKIDNFNIAWSFFFLQYIWKININH